MADCHESSLRRSQPGRSGPAPAIAKATRPIGRAWPPRTQSAVARRPFTRLSQDSPSRCGSQRGARESRDSIDAGDAARHRRGAERSGPSQQGRCRTPACWSACSPSRSAASSIRRSGKTRSSTSRRSASGPDDRIVTIASGGCNALSYLTADPAEIVAVDLNGAHVALNRLKLCALKHLPDYDAFLSFFGRADSRANVAPTTPSARPPRSRHARLLGRARRRRPAAASTLFARNFYRHGLLGRFIGAGHALARLLRLRSERDAEARIRSRSNAPCSSAHLAPIFDKPLVRWLTRQPASLYGLGIPAGAVSRAVRRFAGRHRRGAAPAARAARLRLRHSVATISPGRRSAALRARAPTLRCRPICSASNFEALRARADRRAASPTAR